jgi:hypothetical protein
LIGEYLILSKVSNAY